MNIQSAANRLSYLLDTLPPRMLQIPGDEFSTSLSPGKWSKKQILGHLIDSAANNHQRFVRVQFENDPHIVYDADLWNEHNYHAMMSQQHLIELWTVLNRHLYQLVQHIPEEKLSRTCITNEPRPVTLEWLINDYVVHMEHHLKQIVNYEG